MPKQSKRLDRIEDQLKQELALLIQNELRDPRLGMLSVIGLRVSRDLAYADVFVTVLGAEPADALAVVNKASGLLRSRLAKNLNLRVTPRLKFIYDQSVEQGRKLSALIDQALAEDAQHEPGTDPASTPEKDPE